MKGPTRKDEASPKSYETKISKMKRLTGTSVAIKAQTVPITYDEAKATCKARKRKERQESVSSLCQERKVIRSNSEERPAQKSNIETKNNIRRVSSSEDFQSHRFLSGEKVNVSPHRGGANDKIVSHEDCEYEKRRSHERFAKPLISKSKKHPNKRLKIRYLSRPKLKPELPSDQHKKSTHADQATKKPDQATDFLQPHREERARSPSPTRITVSPVLDFSVLREQIDCSEPVLSLDPRDFNEDADTMLSASIASNRLLSSPRNSIIATHRIYLDPDVPKMTSSLDNKPQNPVDERLHKLNKQINSLKKKIKKYEADFEDNYGFKPAHIDKTQDKNLRNLYADLSKMKKDQKQLTEISSTCSLIKSEENSTADLQVTINDIDKKLSMKRQAANRSVNLDEMSSEQLMDEKIAIQKALLYFESVHGRPNSKDDRNLVRPFYDRYRILKRMVGKGPTANSSGIELATILENEAMNFTTPSSSQSIDTESEKTILQSTSTDSDSDSSLVENIHSMTRGELMEQLRTVTEEKKHLRRKIKEWEIELQTKTGRMVQKEDKLPMESVYVAYKKIKGKLRLLEALIGKPTQ